jgi:hypothetical protein
MSEYDFYCAQLRFVAERTERQSPFISEMMDCLESFALNVENSPRFSISVNQARTTGRALAGVAGFLQQHILPEVVAAGDSTGERQIRWVIDTSMELTAAMTVHAETDTDGSPCPVELPDPPKLDC